MVVTYPDVAGSSIAQPDSDLQLVEAGEVASVEARRYGVWQW